MATAETAWTTSDGPVHYHGGEVRTELGDRIEFRGLFRKRQGAVIYVPGISPTNPEIDFGSLHWIVIAFDNGTFTGMLVDPDTGCILKKVAFLERGPTDSLPPVPDPFE